MKVDIVKEVKRVMACDVSPAAMFIIKVKQTIHGSKSIQSNSLSIGHTAHVHLGQACRLPP